MIKMKKLKSFLFISLICFLGGTVAVSAWSTGGSAGGGGSIGGDTNMPTDGGSSRKTGVYRYDLVYRAPGENYISGNKPKNWYGCVVAYGGSYSGSIPNHSSKARKYALRSGCSYQTDGLLADLSSFLYNGNQLDDKEIDTKTEAVKYFKQFGMSTTQAKKKGSDPGSIDSYGYRILVQQLSCWGEGAAWVESGSDWCIDMVPRKEVASTYSNANLFGGSYQGDLFTTKSDMGIRASGLSRNGNPWAAFKTPTIKGDPLWSKFEDSYDGTGYNIIGFAKDVFNSYDYTIDAACTGCDSKTNYENRAYVVQDTTNWEAIKGSTEVSDELNSNIKTYYTKDRIPGYYCREEYHIKFPSGNNQIKVETGRYFGVNEDPSNTVLKQGTPNFAPITYETIAQCVAQNGGGNQNTVLNHYKQEKYSQGSITLKYNERAEAITSDKEQRYKGTYKLKPTTVYSDIESVSGGVITYKRVDNYKLDWDVYRYMLKGSARSIADTGYASEKDLPTEFKAIHEDLKVPNLPISFNNIGAGTDKIGADVKLTFDLPSSSKMRSAFNAENKYLAGTAEGDNIYKKAINNSFSGDDVTDFENSACAKLYGIKTISNSDVKKCASARQTNKIGDKATDNCYTRNTSEKYECPVRIGYNEKCDPKVEICCELGVTPCADGTCPTAGQGCPNLCPDGSVPINGECSNTCEKGKCNIMDLVYRPIDLHFPFPGQAAKGRDTGTNWCGYNIQTKKYNCKGNKNANEIAKNKILDTADNLYDGTPMYSVELNAGEIKNIQKYNKTHSYDDFTLNCTKGICTSDFIRNSSMVGKLTGSCEKKSSADTCKAGGGK